MIRFDGLCAGYDGVERLHGVTCSIPRGRLVALIGPNGCGKSTLIKCVAGILRPTAGQVLLDESPLTTLPPKQLATKISYMPQSRLAPSIPVRQLVSHGRYPHLKWGRNLSAADRDIIAHAMERTDTARYADRSVSQLSGGERQRAYLAMMLAQQTPAMLLDEPTTYLDLSSQFALMDLLAALRDEGRTIVLVLHDLSLALEYADELLLMQRGTMVEAGSPDAIYTSGALEAVFGIRVERTPGGKYVFYKKPSLEGTT